MNPRAEALKKRTFEFGLKVISFCRPLRNTWEGCLLSDQLFRAGTRVGANYRSACRARSHADFVAKMGFVVEEADETIYWLELISASKVAAGFELQSLLDEGTELSRIFNQSQLTARRNAAARRTPVADRQSVNPHSVNSHSVNPQSVNPQSVNPQSVNPQSVNS